MIAERSLSANSSRSEGDSMSPGSRQPAPTMASGGKVAEQWSLGAISIPRGSGCFQLTYAVTRASVGAGCGG